MSDNPIADIGKLAGRVGREVKAEGMPMQRFALVPDDEDSAHVEIILALDEDHKPKDANDDLLEGILAATREQEAAEKAKEAIDGLEALGQQLKDPGKGIL